MPVLLVMLSMLSQSCATGSEASKIDELLTYCYENDIINGTVLVAREGEVVYKKAFGYENFNNMEALTPVSAFSIGSVSKTFTSMAVMILKEENKLQFDDKLADYFPEFPYANQITIRHLLNHQSGIPRYINFGRFRVKGRPGDFIDDITNEDVFEFLVQLDSLSFTPGEKYSYTNSGYVLLAMIVEKVSGQPFYTFMKENIFDPLDLKHTLVWNATKPEIPNKTTGYDPFGEKDDYNILTYGDGGIYSTVEDLYKWDRGLYTEKIISQETLKEAFTPPTLNDGTTQVSASGSSYGFGWIIKRDSVHNVVFHDGGFNGFNAIFYRELDRKEVIIFLTNKGTPWQLYPIHEAVIDILDGESYEFPPIPIAITVKPLIDEQGITESTHRYHELREAHPARYDFSERQLNSLGYYYLEKQKFSEAKVLFQLNIDMYPHSANVYDSYGEACMLNGDYDEAIRNYERSLELDPENTNAVDMLKRIHERMVGME
jgi:CubicO group peptidase (beta-lactamase class C family)